MFAMFIGHFGVSFLLKKKFNVIPLWLLFVSVQLLDILFSILSLLGVEKVLYNPSSNVFLRLNLVYMPFSHSLLGALIISSLVYLIFLKFKNKTWGLVLSIGVFSHWVLDLLVHTADLPLIFNSYKVGLGLWNFLWVAFFIEVAFFVVTLYCFYINSKKVKRVIPLLLFGVVLFTSFMFLPEKEMPAIVLAVMNLVNYTIFTVLAYFAKRKNK